MARRATRRRQPGRELRASSMVLARCRRGRDRRRAGRGRRRRATRGGQCRPRAADRPELDHHDRPHRARAGHGQARQHGLRRRRVHRHRSGAQHAHRSPSRTCSRSTPPPASTSPSSRRSSRRCRATSSTRTACWPSRPIRPPTRCSWAAGSPASTTSRSPASPCSTPPPARSRPGVVQRTAPAAARPCVNAIYRVGTQAVRRRRASTTSAATARAAWPASTWPRPASPVDGWEAPVQGGMVARLRRRPERRRSGSTSAAASPRPVPASNPRGRVPGRLRHHGHQHPPHLVPAARRRRQARLGARPRRPERPRLRRHRRRWRPVQRLQRRPGATKLLVKQTRANGNVQAVKVLGNTVFFGGHYDFLDQPVVPARQAERLSTSTRSQPDTTLKVRLSGVWGVFAIMGDERRTTCGSAARS